MTKKEIKQFIKDDIYHPTNHPCLIKQATPSENFGLASIIFFHDKFTSFLIIFNHNISILIYAAKGSSYAKDISFVLIFKFA